MSRNLTSENIEQLLAEADELIQQINSGAIKHMKEEHRLQFEIHAQNLEKIKSEVQDKIEKKEISESMHKAIQDIVQALKAMTSYLT